MDLQEQAGKPYLLSSPRDVYQSRAYIFKVDDAAGQNVGLVDSDFASFILLNYTRSTHNGID